MALKLTDRILKIRPDQKSIIASGYSESVRVKEAQSLGAGTYIKKPYLLQKIGQAIRSRTGEKVKIQPPEDTKKQDCKDD